MAYTILLGSLGFNQRACAQSEYACMTRASEYGLRCGSSCSDVPSSLRRGGTCFASPRLFLSTLHACTTPDARHEHELRGRVRPAFKPYYTNAGIAPERLPLSATVRGLRGPFGHLDFVPQLVARREDRISWRTGSEVRSISGVKIFETRMTCHSPLTLFDRDCPGPKKRIGWVGEVIPGAREASEARSGAQWL